MAIFFLFCNPPPLFINLLPLRFPSAWCWVSLPMALTLADALHCVESMLFFFSPVVFLCVDVSPSSSVAFHAVHELYQSIS